MKLSNVAIALVLVPVAIVLAGYCEGWEIDTVVKIILHRALLKTSLLAAVLVPVTVFLLERQTNE